MQNGEEKQNTLSESDLGFMAHTKKYQGEEPSLDLLQWYLKMILEDEEDPKR